MRLDSTLGKELMLLVEDEDDGCAEQVWGEVTRHGEMRVAKTLSEGERHHSVAMWRDQRHATRASRLAKSRVWQSNNQFHSSYSVMAAIWLLFALPAVASTLSK